METYSSGGGHACSDDLNPRFRIWGSQQSRSVLVVVLGDASGVARGFQTPAVPRRLLGSDISGPAHCVRILHGNRY